MSDSVNEKLYDFLSPHEGGGPSITIGYDDATFKFVCSRKLRFGSTMDVHGYGSTIIGALNDLEESLQAIRLTENPL